MVMTSLSARTAELGPAAEEEDVQGHSYNIFLERSKFAMIAVMHQSFIADLVKVAQESGLSTLSTQYSRIMATLHLQIHMQIRPNCNLVEVE